jgi:cytochrome P450
MEHTDCTPQLLQATPQPRGPAPRGRLCGALTQAVLLLNPLKAVSQRFQRFGDTYRVQQTNGHLYVTRDADHARDILVTHATAFDKQHSAFQLLARVLGDGLVTSDGEHWRRQRRLTQPAFARPRMQQYSELMVEEAARACSQLAQRSQIDLSREMNRLTLRVVTRSLFGQVWDDDGETAATMVELNRLFLTPPQWLRVWPGAQRRFDRTVAQLDAIMDRIIAAKRDELTRPDAATGDLMSTLMLARDEHGQALSSRDLRDQLLTLYLAGHETTSHALTWTLYLLTQHPDVCAKLQDELAQVLGGRLPTFDDLPALPYTEQVIKEGLRLYPPAFTLPRRACADTQIGPYSVAKGDEVVVWVYHVHRDPRVYPEPERFRPERFSAQQEATRPKYAYLPFGAGQRACIGQMFAMLEAQLILATLLSRLRFEYAAKRAPRIRLGVTLAPRDGMPMRVTPRSINPAQP